MDQHTESMELYQSPDGTEMVWLMPVIAAAFYRDWVRVPREDEMKRRVGDGIGRSEGQCKSAAKPREANHE